jgi:hypothetical protein
MSTLAIHVPESRTAFEPGEQLNLKVEWELDEDAESVELRAVWRTMGKGDADIGVAHTVQFDLPSRRETRQASFELPRAPHSFSGKLISLVWALELIALPSEDFGRLDITIAPQSEEIALNKE